MHTDRSLERRLPGRNVSDEQRGSFRPCRSNTAVLERCVFQTRRVARTARHGCLGAEVNVRKKKRLSQRTLISLNSKRSSRNERNAPGRSKTVLGSARARRDARAAEALALETGRLPANYREKQRSIEAASRRRHRSHQRACQPSHQSLTLLNVSSRQRYFHHARSAAFTSVHRLDRFKPRASGLAAQPHPRRGSPSLRPRSTSRSV